MNIFVSGKQARNMRFVNEDRTSFEDVRRYYLLDTSHGPALIVLRNNLTPMDIEHCIVDAAVGWDVAYAGFCAEEHVGQKRAKVTIYRLVRHGGRLFASSLAALLKKRVDLWK